MSEKGEPMMIHTDWRLYIHKNDDGSFVSRLFQISDCNILEKLYTRKNNRNLLERIKRNELHIS